MREVCFGNLIWLDKSEVKLSLPLIMLSFLLFNAGLAAKTQDLKSLVKYPKALIVGLTGNILIPIVFIYFIKNCLFFWHNQDETQNILVGLAILGSMPIASSSTAWTQNTEGNLGLSLGLVNFSTILSPFSTPIILHCVGFMTLGEYSKELHELANHGTGAFIAFSVFMPSTLGIIIHKLMGEKRVNRIKPSLKLFNSFILISLIYSNAAISLPQIVSQPDLDFHLIILIITLIMCSGLFFTGWLISKFLKARNNERISLIFALGMNNNGVGLVLASMALANHPLILVPIIFYNLAQHIIASIVSTRISKFK
jgi:BASS family bile acid:Na+ symporter